MLPHLNSPSLVASRISDSLNAAEIVKKRIDLGVHRYGLPNVTHISKNKLQQVNHVFGMDLAMGETWLNLKDSWERVMWARKRFLAQRHPELSEHKRSAKLAAEQYLTMDKSTYGQYERDPNGSSRGARLDEEKARHIGGAFGVDWSWLMTGKGSPFDHGHNFAMKSESPFNNSAIRVGMLPKENAHSPQKARMVPVVGYVQAGAFKAVNDFEYIDENTEYRPFSDPAYDGANVVALRVIGNSCDLVYPEGSEIFVAPAHEVGVRLGALVIVQQFDVTGQAETTLKRVTVVDGAVILQPQSSDKAIRPIPYKRRDEHAQEGPEIRWVVVGSYQKAPAGQGPLLSI